MRLIDADKMTADLNDFYHGSYSEVQLAPYQVDRWIVKQPTVTPSVEHAHWIERRANNGNVHYVCSCCGKEVSYPYAKKRWKYCIECGAKMDDHEGELKS